MLVAARVPARTAIVGPAPARPVGTTLALRPAFLLLTVGTGRTVRTGRPIGPRPALRALAARAVGRRALAPLAAPLRAAAGMAGLPIPVTTVQAPDLDQCRLGRRGIGRCLGRGLDGSRGEVRGGLGWRRLGGLWRRRRRIERCG